MSATGTADFELLKRRNRRLGIRLGLFAVAMLGFACLLWKFGGVLCDWAGIGIAPNQAPANGARVVDDGAER